MGIPTADREDATIKAFGKEWTQHKEHGDFFQSEELFNRFLPGSPVATLRNKRLVEVGCGGGRWLKLIGENAAPKVLFGLEPSDAAYVAAERTRELPNVCVIRGSVYGMPFRQQMDTVFSIGVLCFVKDMRQAGEEISKILAPGGEFAYWVYSYEGNELYLKVFPTIQALARRLSDRQLRCFCKLTSGVLLLHARTLNSWLSALGIRLPKASYLNMYRKLTWPDAELVIYDQLIPEIRTYLTREEMLAIIPPGLNLKEIHTPSGMSWSAVAVKSAKQAEGVAAAAAVNRAAYSRQQRSS